MQNLQQKNQIQIEAIAQGDRKIQKYKIKRDKRSSDIKYEIEAYKEKAELLEEYLQQYKL